MPIAEVNREGVRINRKEGLRQRLKENQHLKVRFRWMRQSFKHPFIMYAPITN